MNMELMKILESVTDEEKRVLERQKIEREIYANGEEFTVDSKKMLAKGELISIRPHARFVNFPKHKHNYVEIMYMCSGSTVHLIDQEEKIILQKGDLLFLSRSVSHEILYAGEKDIGINFIILPEFFDRAYEMVDENNVLARFIISNLRRENDGPKYLHFKVSDVLPVQNLIENMIYSLLNRKENDQKINQITMGLLFLQLEQYTDKIQSSPEDSFSRFVTAYVMRYIEQHYKTATLTELAYKMEQPVPKMSRIVKSVTGATFKELLQERRFDKALQMLRETSLPVTDIILSVGYENNSYFHRRFREKYHMSPKEYRMEYKRTGEVPVREEVRGKSLFQEKERFRENEEK